MWRLRRNRAGFSHSQVLSTPIASAEAETSAENASAARGKDHHCGDTYRITTANGKTRNFWERNLRLKTDSSADGPRNGIPALIPAGMAGDRADVIFADPGEITRFIKPEC